MIDLPSFTEFKLKRRPKEVKLDVALADLGKFRIPVIMAVVADMLCKSCQKYAKIIKQKKCKQKYCVRSNRTEVARLRSGSIIKETIQNYVSGVATKGPIDDPGRVIPIISDVMCKLCSDIKDTKNRKECEKKYCLRSKSFSVKSPEKNGVITSESVKSPETNNSSKLQSVKSPKTKSSSEVQSLKSPDVKNSTKPQTASINSSVRPDSATSIHKKNPRRPSRFRVKERKKLRAKGIQTKQKSV